MRQDLADLSNFEPDLSQFKEDLRPSHLYLISRMYTTGCGNFPLKSMSVLPDPCPLPDKTKKRSLNEKEKLIYAPMAGVGGIVYDKASHCFCLFVCCFDVVTIAPMAELSTTRQAIVLFVCWFVCLLFDVVTIAVGGIV